jgi:flavorubredoxin
LTVVSSGKWAARNRLAIDYRPSGLSLVNQITISGEGIMESNVTEIAPDVYRISTFHPDFGIQLNQFLIKDDEPFIMHTGLKKMFPVSLAAVATLIEPAKLRWIGFSHFESDECGALNEWLAIAPNAQAVLQLCGRDGHGE